MNRPQHEWVKRWRGKVASMALFGTTSDLRDGPLTRAAKILDIPDAVDELLRLMWEDDQKAVAPPVANGKAEAPVAPKKA